MYVEMVRFYTELFGFEDSGVKSCDVDVLKGLLGYELSCDVVVSLVKEVAWDIVQVDFLAAIKEFFQSGTLLLAFNATSIVLVPKTPNAVLAALGLLEVFRVWIRSCITGARFYVAFNGSLVGVFKGRREIRQRDPLSPYLFILVMNGLSHLINVAAKNGLIRFHPKCKRVSLTHLSFADDLLIFCHGDESSILSVVGVLGVFYELSGLQLNAGKSELFACGVHNDILSKVQAVTGFKLGRFPVKYLGVPLITRKLLAKDYLPLIDKIKSKLSMWSKLRLSYGGRLQLIQFVLFSISNYWCRQLVLPNEVIKQVDQLCMRFFWKGGDIPARGARVSWLQMCWLKSDSGLGLKSLGCWKKVCCFLLIKNILANAGSLWVAWIKEYALKGTAFWEASTKPQLSWILRKLLKLRNEAADLFGSVVD
ncbi:uncharacterized protein LOC120135149 [Hibiscus syriacus]|uniref:uncharacterized protein LOC120135149 n=1 Tax=Hibiscus syriacus TaxID=106335 RepID=UPI0019211E2C|nr:uncharacterized protein LOC120135149 [Hibiscus syriacus]